MIPKQKLPSNKKFGLFFSIIFLIAAFYFWWQKKNGFYCLFFLANSIIFIFLSLFASRALYPLNKWWQILGIFLQKVISPLVLAILFFLVISPVAVITRIFGRDTLKLKKTVLKKTYWERRNNSIAPKSFRDQF
jgi:Saxitoxin biosynthesis operon protein SxtJ